MKQKNYYILAVLLLAVILSSCAKSNGIRITKENFDETCGGTECTQKEITEDSFIDEQYVRRDIVSAVPEKSPKTIVRKPPQTRETAVVEKVKRTPPPKLSVDDIRFEFDKYDILPVSINTLSAIIKTLNDDPSLKLHLSGHTDNRGCHDYNVDLSRKRAEAVKKYLIEKGIDPLRISISWHSSDVPITSNETAEGRSLNRRTEFKFVKKDSE